MTAKLDSGTWQGNGRARIASLACGVALALSVCGSGGGATSAQNEFTPVEQTGGKVTVWVDSTTPTGS